MTRVGGFEAAVFDCDGTLVDSESVWMDMIRNLLSKHGLDTGAAYVEGFRGVAAVAAAREIARQRGMPVQEVEDELNAEYSELLSSGSAPMPEAAAFLARVKAAVPTAVASNGRRADVTLLLANAGLMEYIDDVVTIDDVAMGKPSPELIESACARLRSTPEKTIVFEDSPTGVAAAQAAGCLVVGLGANAEVNRAADLTVPGFGDLDITVVNNKIYFEHAVQKQES